MFDIAGRIIISLLSLFTFIVGFFFTILFVFIPTVLLKPDNQISYIESDLCIDIPNEYEVIDKYSDFLGFEEKIELTLKFNEEDFDLISNQINENNCENGTWVENESDYNFINKTNFIDHHEYYFDALVDEEERVMKYNYYGF